jgi:hypothetical protein
MYLSKHSPDVNLSFYALLFRKLAEGYEVPSKGDIDSAIFISSQIKKGEKSIFDASSNYFNLVTYLISDGPEILDQVENGISKRTYESIEKGLSEISV